jgi:WD40-like Beta Propeller Repeat
VRHVAAVASMLLVVACSAPEGRPDPAPEPSAACGATLGDGARPGGQLAWSSEDEDVFVDSLDDEAPAARVGEAGIRDLDPDLSPSGTLAWRRGPDPATDAADIVSGGRNLTQAAQENNWGPAWSPDGTRLAYSSTRDSGSVPRLWTMAADGSDQRLVTSGHGEYPDWSPDGTQLVFAAPGSAGAYDVFVVPIDGDERTPIVSTPSTDFFPTWSPDGRWIAFHRLEAGVFVVRPDGSAEKRISPDADAGGPVWTPDSRLGWTGPSGFRVTDVDACTSIQLSQVNVELFPSWAIPAR